MAHAVMNKFKAENMKGNVALDSDTLKVALIDNIFGSSSTDQLDNLDYWDDISATWEITGTNYSANGETLLNTAVSESDSSNWGSLSADNVTWSNATLTSYGCAIYRSSDRLLVCLIDFGGAKSATAGDFTISWSANGILNLT